MVSGCAEYPVRGCVVPCDIIGTTVGSEVINHEEHVLSMKGEDLQRIAGG